MLYPSGFADLQQSDRSQQVLGRVTHNRLLDQKMFQFALHPNCSCDPHNPRLSSLAGYGLPTYLFVQSTPSFADGALARSLTMPAPMEKSSTFCQPS